MIDPLIADEWRKNRSGRLHYMLGISAFGVCKLLRKEGNGDGI
jgi:hypothetical protein